MKIIRKKIGEMTFSLVNPMDIKKFSVAKVITPELYDIDGYPVDGGLMDLRLGAIDPGVRCRTCRGGLKERYDSDKVILPICTKCGSVAIEDTIRGKIMCSRCESEEVEMVEIAYAFKLLVEELQGMHIKTTFGLKNKYE